MTISAIRIHPDDNVICLLRDHLAGETPVLAENSAPELRADTPLGHKIALSDIASGNPVVKYGKIIGRATAAIRPGEHVHLHNIVGEGP